MNKRLTAAFSVSALTTTLIMGASAQAVIVEVGTEVGNGEDAALFNDGGIIGQTFADEPGGGSGSMDIRLLQDGTFNQRLRAGIMRMDLSGVTESFSNLVSAGLKVQNVSQQREVTVYGLNDGDAGESWDASTITWNTAPGLTPNPSYADVLVIAGQVDTARWTELGYWSPAGPGSGAAATEFSTTYTSTENPAGWTDAEAAFAEEYNSVDVDPLLNGNIASFLQADTDGLVSLLFVISERTGPSNGGSPAIRTQEWVLDPENAASALTTPTIVMEFGGGLPGDLNGDGFVGLDDLDIILGAWNQNVPPADPAADPSGDGFVGLDDLDVVLNNWNAGTPPAASVVPEPTSLVLLGLGGLAMFSRTRRH